MKRNNKCYSQAEMGFMLWGQNIRGYILEPFLKALKKKGVTPNHITIISLSSGLLAACLIGFENNIALVLILLHVIFDGIDGPLARYTNKSSNKGEFADVAADQVVIAAVGLSLINAGIVSPLAGSVYILLYTVVIGFSMVLNAFGKPYSWLIRPRFLLYLWLYFEFNIISGYTTNIIVI